MISWALAHVHAPRRRQMMGACTCALECSLFGSFVARFVDLAGNYCINGINNRLTRDFLFTRSQDQFLRQKIERFFWRDFSGEELLPENRFLGQ